jgi:hypothetical protein
VRRVRGEDDMRDVFILPTSKGMEWVEEMERLVFDYMQEGLSRLEDDEQRQFIALFSKFVGAKDDVPFDKVMENLMKRPLTKEKKGSNSASTTFYCHHHIINEISIRSPNTFINQATISRRRLELWNSLTL